MQTLTAQIKESGSRLRETGTALVTTTVQATNAFMDAGLSASREAYVALIAALNEASEQLLTEAKGASDEAREALLVELEAWKTFAEARLSELPLPAESATVPDAAQITAQLRTAPRAAEEQVLKAVQKLLSDVGTRVEGRLGSLESSNVVALPAEKRAKPAKSRKKTAAKAVSAPIKDYDSLTAREAAQKISTLTLSKVEAIAEYERAHKNRTTVLRATKARLAG